MPSRKRSVPLVSAPTREADVVRRAFNLINERLPRGWSATVREEVALGDSRYRVDGLVEVAAPDGTTAVLVLEAKRSVVTRDLAGVVEQLRHHAERIEALAVPVVAARYLPTSARQWLEDHEVSYIDATGNTHLTLDRPALFIRDVGADRDPWRGPGRPRGTLKGAPAARVVRALVDFATPVSVPELVRRSGASTGATYRVVEFLENEALIDREPRGVISVPQWRRLLERWSEDYGFQHSNDVHTYLQPRGLPALQDSLMASSQLRYVLTGSLAAQRLAPYAEVRLAMVYVEDPATVAKRLGLRPLDDGANVLLARADHDVVFERLVHVDGLNYAAPSQTAVDLLTGPGRNPAEAQALLDWMETHEADWRQ